MDGVLVIPEEVVEEVLTKAEEAKEVEDKVRAEIRRECRSRTSRRSTAGSSIRARGRRRRAVKIVDARTAVIEGNFDWVLVKLYTDEGSPSSAKPTGARGSWSS